MVNNVTNPNAIEYKLTSIILDIAAHRFFKPVDIKKDEIDKRSFLKLSFANKCPDGNILHHKSVNSKMPPYFKDHIISYAYTIPMATQIFNYKHVLHDLNIDDFKSKPPDCTCASSPFIYNPVITGDLKIINNISLRDVFAKWPKYREPKSLTFSWIPSRIIPDNGQNV